MKVRSCVLVLAAVALSGCDDDPNEPSNRLEEHFGAIMNSSNEVSPPVAITSSATGTAALRVVSRRADAASAFAPETLYYTLTYSGLTDSTKGAHIHGPASSTQNASVILNFAPPTTTFTSYSASGTVPGTLAVPAIGLDSLVKLFRAQQSYVNVHSKTYTAGEIRGQVVPLTVPD